MFTYCASTFAEHIKTKCSSVARQERTDKTCVRLQHKQFQCMQQYNQPHRYGKKSESFSCLAAHRRHRLAYVNYGMKYTKQIKIAALVAFQ